MVKRRSYKNVPSENWDYYLGNHWPYWIGPVAEGKDVQQCDALNYQLERVFQSSNVIAQCINNWRNALIGKQFQWVIMDESGDPIDPEDPVNDDIVRWLDWVQESAALNQYTFPTSDPWENFVITLGVCRNAYLRLWTPERYMDDPDPIRRFHLLAADDSNVTITYSTQDGFVDYITYQGGGNISERQRVVGDALQITNSSTSGSEPIVIDTDGKYWIQFASSQILTESVKRQQNALNHALTMAIRNNTKAGFLDKVWLNAVKPKEDTQAGPGIERFYYGVADVDGQPSNPDVKVFDPVDPSGMIDSKESIRQDMYGEFLQLHLATGADGSISEESRIQQRADFAISLLEPKSQIESVFSETITQVLRQIDDRKLRCNVSLNISNGTIPAGLRTAYLAEYSAGIVPLEDAISRLEISDSPQEVISRLEQQALPGPVDPPTD